ncbi:MULTISPECIES: phage tail spike protein [unclassified Clostridium]|uniref:phage tail spike protein n=1 Tax=unclassified Clostridium TaxID=2614128 RepID=UPI0032170E0E
MLQLYDLNKVKISNLTLYKDLKIQSVLSNGDKTLSFSYPSRFSDEIKEEGYIRTKTHEFVIKEISTNGDWKSIKAVLNVEALEGKSWEHFDTSNQTIAECLTLALAGTGWIIGYCNETKKRTIRKINCSTWDIIQDIKKTYFVEMEFDTLNKRINIAKKLGNDKGVYFIDSLNLRDLDVKSNSYDFCTRLIAIGENDLKVTVENYQYSSKKKTIIWKAEKYTDENSLREDAIAKLEELSKPYKSYGADIVDLASINDKYSLLSYGLGDIITLISKEEGIKEKQRIVKMVEYPDEPDKNTCEIANTILTFEDMQKEYEDTSKTVNNITSSNGTISEGAIKGTVEKITINKADIQSLNAVEIRVGDLEATSATITQLDAANANIVKLQADKADIIELNAGVGRIEILESSVGDIQTLVNGNLTSNNIQSLILTSDKVTVDNGFIKNAMIENLDVSKINSGDISTNKFKIKSDNGGIEITGATQQFKDKNNRVRIQMGQDIKGDFNFILRGEDGTTTLIDHTGIKENAIGDDLIKGNMISENSVGGKQIDYNSFIEEFNKDTNTHTLKSSKVLLDKNNQTLDIAFNTLSTTVDEIEVGGRNLLIKSRLDYIPSSSSGTGSISEIVEDTIHGKVLHTNKQYVYGSELYLPKGLLKVGDKVTLSILIKAKANSDFTCQLYNTATISNTFTFNATTEWQWLSFTQTVVGDPNLDSRLYLYFKPTDEYWIKNIKVELGNKSTDWTPAPEDIDASIQGVKTITESNTTALNIQQGKISALISNTTIVKDGVITQLKDAYNSTVTTVESISSTISSHTSTINNLTGQVSGVENKTNDTIRDLDKTKSTVSAHSTSISGLNETVTTQASTIEQMKDSIALKVETTQVNNIVNGAIDKIEVGGRNLVLNSDFKNTYKSSSITDKHDNLYATEWSGYNGGVPNPTTSYHAHIDIITFNYPVIEFNESDGNGQWKCISQNIERTLSDFSELVVSMDVFSTGIGTKLFGGIHHYLIGGISLGFHSGQYTLNNFPVNKWVRVYAKVPLLDTIDFTRERSFYIYGYGFQTDSIVYIKNVKLEKGNKPTDWSPAPEDVENKITTVSKKAASIELDLGKVTTRVEGVEQTTETVDGKVTLLTNRVSNAEQKITDTAIVSTVRSSTYYKNDLGAKVSSNEIISCINQTAESIKISASKINLTGYVTMTNLSTAGQTTIDGGNIKTNTISLERLKSATNNPIIRLFGKCSLDATAKDELGVGSAVRLKWDASNYLYISSNKTDIYQGGISKYTFNPAGLTVTDADVIINSGFLVIGGKKNRGWGFSSGNNYWFGLSGDDVYVRMYNDAVNVLNGVSYLGSPSGRFIKLYSTQAADVSSDRRKKNNILAYDEKIETFYENLKPISYELINGHSGRKHYGFIAQDVEDAMDVAGLDYKDMALLQKAPMDAKGNEIDPTSIVDYSTDERIVDYEYSLAYTEMISINTHMIQKLRAEITQLKNEINEINEIKGLG